MYRLLATIVILFSTLFPDYPNQERLLIPIGGGYVETFPGFIATVAARAKENTVKILILPITLASNPYTITMDERESLIKQTEERRIILEEACKQVVPITINCQVGVGAIFTYDDANNPEILKYFPKLLTAVFIPGGDPRVAMRVIQGTMTEKALLEAYQRGVIIAGTAGGGDTLSRTMLSGLYPGFREVDALNFGAVDVWLDPARSGLNFGLSDVIIETQFYQYGRLPRLINAITLPESPHVGLGIDTYTGAQIINEQHLENVFGLNTITILDAETYHSAKAVRYIGAQYTISLRNVLFHLLAPGKFSFDLLKRQHSLAPPALELKREYTGLSVPVGSAPLVLVGGIKDQNWLNSLLRDFANLCGGENAEILIVANGFEADENAIKKASLIKDTLRVKSKVEILSSNQTDALQVSNQVSGIILIGEDQSLIQPERLLAIRNAWRSGIPVLVTGPAIAVVGKYYVAEEPDLAIKFQTEYGSQEYFQDGQVNIQPGLNLLDILVEPNLLDGNRWAFLISLAYSHPELLAVSLSEGTALEISSRGAFSSGSFPIFVLDLRNAQLSVGTNEVYVIANGLLDVFSPGEILFPTDANVQFIPLPVGTPAFTPQVPTTWIATPTLVTAITTPKPTPTREVRFSPTRTPQPTLKPIEIPPPADPNMANMIIAAGLIVVIVVIIGVWVNRFRLR